MLDLPVPPPPTCSAHRCTSTDLATMDGVNGLRCKLHPPTYLRGHALRLVDRGDAAGAFIYLRTMQAFQARSDGAA